VLKRDDYVMSFAQVSFGAFSSSILLNFKIGLTGKTKHILGVVAVAFQFCLFVIGSIYSCLYRTCYIDKASLKQSMFLMTLSLKYWETGVHHHAWFRRDTLMFFGMHKKFQP
jgi:high-affinity Fe2+/Pb2+ permease